MSEKDELEVEVRVFASLSEFAPTRPRLRIRAKSTLNDLIEVLGMPIDGRYIILVNTVPEWNRNRVLGEGDIIAIFPPLAGG